MIYGTVTGSILSKVNVEGQCASGEICSRYLPIMFFCVNSTAKAELRKLTLGDIVTLSGEIAPVPRGSAFASPHLQPDATVYIVVDQVLNVSTEIEPSRASVCRFVNELCNVNATSKVSVGVLYDAYLNWCPDDDLTIKTFREKLSAMGFGTRRTGTTRFVTGIILK